MKNMKSAQDLISRIGGNMKESMGANRAAGGAPPPAPANPTFHGETGTKYRGAARIKDALAIDLDRLAPDPDQPRKEFDPGALAELASSLKSRGQLQPIRVRWDDAVSRWIIVAGERRYRAAELAGLTSLMCIEAKGELTPDDILEDQLVENCVREDLKPIEQALAFKALIDRRGWTYRQLAEAIHVAPASIARALALLELPGDLQASVTDGELAPSVAYELSRLDDPEAQREVAARVVAEGLSRSEAVEVVHKAAAKSKGRGASKGKAKRKPARLPAEIKHRGPNGVRFVAHTAARHGWAEVASDLRSFLARIEAELDARPGDRPCTTPADEPCNTATEAA